MLENSKWVSTTTAAVEGRHHLDKYLYYTNLLNYTDYTLPPRRRSIVHSGILRLSTCMTGVRIRST